MLTHNLETNSGYLFSNSIQSSALYSYSAHIQSSTPTVSIRHAEANDYEELHQLVTNPQIIYWTADLPLRPASATYEALKNPSGDRYSLVACGADEIVGALTFEISGTPRLRHGARVKGVMVRQDWQGRGVGSELMKAAIDLADNWLNLKRLDLLVYEDNTPAINLYAKHGFVTEGTLRSLAFRDGRYVNAVLMARING